MGIYKTIKIIISIAIMVLLLYYVIDVESFNWSHLNNFSGLLVFLFILVIGLYLNGLQLNNQTHPINWLPFASSEESITKSPSKTPGETIKKVQFTNNLPTF